MEFILTISVNYCDMLQNVMKFCVRGGNKMVDYEMSEQLFQDIWEKYGCPDEVDNVIEIYAILNELIVESKHRIVLDHYSHINFDEIIKVDYDEKSNIFKLYWLDNNSYRLANLKHELSDWEGLVWSMSGYCTYEYIAIDICKIKFVNIKGHIFLLIQSNMVTEKEMKKKVIGKNEIIEAENCTEDLYARYTFWEGDKEELVKVECIANNLPYYVCVIQPKERIPSTGYSKKLMLKCTLKEINSRLQKVKKSLNKKALDKDEIFSKGNTIRNIMEYALKHFCVIMDIPLEIEKKYGHIDLGDLKKKIKEQNIELSQSLINKANELSHDSGKKYTVEDIEELYLEVMEVMENLQNIILTVGI